MTRRNLNREDGWVLVSAIVLMAIMLSVGLSAFAFVDTGQKRSRESRERESSLSLAEASLYAQGFALAKNWPNAGKQLGGDCSSAAALTSATLYCPDRDTLAKGSSSNPSAAQFTDVDFGANVDLGDERARQHRRARRRLRPGAGQQHAGRPRQGPVPADAVPDGLERRPPAVGPGEGHRPRPPAQHRRAPEARAAARERPAGRRRLGLAGHHQQRQQADARRHRRRRGRALLAATSSTCADYAPAKGQLTPPPTRPQVSPTS